MKLLFINYEFPPLGGGGGNANAAIARELASMGHEVAVVTSHFKSLKRFEKIDGVSIHRIPTLRKYQEKCRVHEMLAFMLMSLPYALWRAYRMKPDVCIAFFTLPSGPAAWLVRLFFKIPYIVSLRGGDVPGFMGKNLWFYHRVSEPLIKFLWRKAKAVVANSEGLKNLALQTSSKLDIMTIPNGVDLTYFNREISENWPSPDVKSNSDTNTVVRLMTAGRLTAQKGIDTLLFALWRLKSHLKNDFQLWIVGDGPLRETLEELTKDLQLEGHVFFQGWCNKLTLREYYESADIFVLPSIDEGMPNVLLEAMAMGLPLVATQISGSEELVEEGKNGFLVPPQDPEKLAEALGALIENDLGRQKMAGASKQKALEYGWKDVAVSYEELMKIALTEEE